VFFFFFFDARKYSKYTEGIHGEEIHGDITTKQIEKPIIISREQDTENTQ